MTQALIDLANNFGLMAAVTLAIFLLIARTGWSMHAPNTQAISGLIFAAMALIVVSTPIRLPTGATFDMRAAPVVLSAFFGGPIAGLITASVAGLARYNVGGPMAIGGAISPFLYLICGLTAAWLQRQRDIVDPGAVRMALLGLAACVFSLPAFFIAVPLDLSLQVLSNIWPMYLLGNVLGIFVLGLIIEETQRIARDRDEAKTAERAAIFALDARARFIAAISHDIRTPLNGLMGALQLAERERSAEAIRPLLQMAHKSGQYLSELVEQVLSYSRAEAGHFPSDLRSFRPALILDNVQSIYAGMAEAKGLSLIVQTERCGDTLVSGPEDALKQIVYNFVGNAIKFTDAGRIEICCEAMPTDDGRIVLGLSVTDTGPGIAAADQARIFEQFVRLEHPVSGQPGSGLGLAIAQTLARSIGAELQLSSTLGLGSRFTVSIVLDQAEAEARQIPARDGRMPEIAAEGRQILVVDDNELNRMLLSTALRSAGFTVEEAEGGRAAITKVSEAPARFAAVLMDIQMPDLHGDAATRIIRKIPGAERLPIIAVTANAFDDQRGEYLAAGMNEVILKPVQFSLLFRKLGQLFASEPVDATAEPIPALASLPGAVFDADQIRELTNVLPADTVRSAVMAALDQVEEDLAALATLPEGLDGPAAARIVHSIKGATANVGLAQISATAKRFEHAADRSHKAECIDALARERSAALAAIDQLEEILVQALSWERTRAEARS